MTAASPENLSQESLGFILAIDNCGRNCEHCPAFGLKAKMETAPFDSLSTRLAVAGTAIRASGLTDRRTIHAWRIGDLLDYRDTSNGQDRTVVDLAEAWNSRLGQPLYTVTNGTMGTPWRRQALVDLADNPDLSSQVKLTVTPFDPKFKRTERYVEAMAHDIATLWPLAQLRSQRPESPNQQRFRVNVKTTPETQDATTDVLDRILRLSGVDIAIDDVLTGRVNTVSIKPVYDLRAQESQPRVPGAVSLSPSLSTRLKPEAIRERHQLGFRPNGNAFLVDLWAFSEEDLIHGDGTPRTFEEWFPSSAQSI